MTMKWMFTIEEMVAATGGTHVSPGKVDGVTNVSIDSREISEGECFVALRGAHFDGRDFVNEAVSKKAALIVTSEEISVPEGTGVISVKDPVQALGDIAAAWRQRFNVPVVAITGSNGKSTTKQMTAATLKPLGNVLKTEGNYNNLIGLPLTVLRWTPIHNVAVLEMGMNAPGEITRLAQIAKPDVGVITNVSSAHLEFLHSIENVAKAKGELFDNMGDDATMIINLEDPWVMKLAKKHKKRSYTFGMQNDADIRFGRMESRELESIDMTIYIEGKEYAIHLAVPGTHNVMNAMAALAVSRVLGVDPEAAIEGLEQFEPMAMRMERVQLSSGVQLINDCYNANPLSVKEALRTVSGAKRAGRFVAILGDMLELGENAPECHRDIGAAAAEHKVDRLFIFGPHAPYVAEGAKGKGLSDDCLSEYSNMELLKKDVLDYVETGDIILVKGSRGMQMERVIEHLKDEMGVE